MDNISSKPITSHYRLRISHGQARIIPCHTPYPVVPGKNMQVQHRPPPLPRTRPGPAQHKWLALQRLLALPSPEFNCAARGAWRRTRSDSVSTMQWPLLAQGWSTRFIMRIRAPSRPERAVEETGPGLAHVLSPPSGCSFCLRLIDACSVHVPLRNCSRQPCPPLLHPSCATYTVVILITAQHQTPQLPTARAPEARHSTSPG